MKLSTHVKSISYLKAHAAEILRDLADVQEPYVITQNGEAKAVIQDIYSYEQTQEALALMKILALGDREIEQGKYEPAAKVFRELREELKSRQ
jgi:prevent-host-death family protein